MFQCDFSVVSVSECVSSAHRAVLKYSSHSHVTLLLLLQPGEEAERGREQEKRGGEIELHFIPAPPPSFHCICINLHLHNTVLCVCSLSLPVPRSFLLLTDKGHCSHFSSSSISHYMSPAVLYQRGTDTPFVFFLSHFR